MVLELSDASFVGHGDRRSKLVHGDEEKSLFGGNCNLRSKNSKRFAVVIVNVSCVIWMQMCKVGQLLGVLQLSLGSREVDCFLLAVKSLVCQTLGSRSLVVPGPDGTNNGTSELKAMARRWAGESNEAKN